MPTAMSGTRLRQSNLQIADGPRALAVPTPRRCAGAVPEFLGYLRRVDEVHHGEAVDHPLDAALSFDHLVVPCREKNGEASLHSGDERVHQPYVRPAGRLG